MDNTLSLFKDITSGRVVTYIALSLLILVINWILRKAAARFSKKSTNHERPVFASAVSLINWFTFYGLILLFLFYFYETKWLFKPLYSQGGVDVTFFLIIVAFMIVSLAHRLVKLFTKYVLSNVYEQYGVDRGLGFTINQIIYYTVMFAALAVSFTSVGLDLTALGAVLGVLGIGIGFGMRNVAGNFVSGIIILFERPIEVGEVIQIDGKIGRVEKIRLRSTLVRTGKEGTLVVPNQYFIEQIIKNRTDAKMIAQVNVSVLYGTDSRLVHQLLEEAVSEVKKETVGILETPPAEVRFIDFRDQAMEFIIELPVLNFEIKERVESDLRHSISKLFCEQNIKLPGRENSIRNS
ncbi:mechanosensitive ion channel protein MscS [Bacillus sp. FJAT-27225]|uniref:mechanosensitive ion channel family protein n=1 Tax=Bacillus sp. FJAT-27225 TaxID=1743144 RepID=UPI00080C3061|nr:mechanosensitive ion channel domain-containing protein [Bacillus sp. FJAT-27225]OCA90667.1 mechanosensitive ion channel protein MscS [Bacillus sp. FJAT-27225]